MSSLTINSSDQYNDPHTPSQITPTHHFPHKLNPITSSTTDTKNTKNS